MFDQKHYDNLMRQLSVIRDRVRGVFYGAASGFYLFGAPARARPTRSSRPSRTWPLRTSFTRAISRRSACSI